jgi:hypothetical protein
MSLYQPVSLSTHANLQWQRYASYAFAKQDALVSLVAQEMTRACTCLPIAFAREGDGFVPVAVQGFQPGQNLWVAPDGRWLAQYVPAAYRGYPFALARTEQDQWVLCADMDSGLVGQFTAGVNAQPFFDSQGQATEPVQEVFRFLQLVQAQRQVTVETCAALQSEGLIVPWTIGVREGAHEREVQGLWRVDEARLDGLDAAALYRLQQAGALPVAFCQRISMQHIAALGPLAQSHAQAAAKAVQPVQPGQTIPQSADGAGLGGLGALVQGDTLRFS